MAATPRQKTVVIGAGPVGSLAALYAAQRGHAVEVYELRNGTSRGGRPRHPQKTNTERVAANWTDLRDPSTTPLNFTKSINLALSTRGITALEAAGSAALLDHVFGATIPMRGRMIHGRTPSGDLYEEAQDYDAHGRVRRLPEDHCCTQTQTRLTSRPSLPSTGPASTAGCWTCSRRCPTSRSSSSTS